MNFKSFPMIMVCIKTSEMLGRDSKALSPVSYPIMRVTTGFSTVHYVAKSQCLEG